MAGLLWPIVFIGERKGVLAILLWHGVDPVNEREDWFDLVREIARSSVEEDPWTVEIGTFHRDPSNERKLTETAGIIGDSDAPVIAYIQAIDVLWQLGEKRSSRSPVITLPLDAFHGAGG